jgi:hypothetical protein
LQIYVYFNDVSTYAWEGSAQGNRDHSIQNSIFHQHAQEILLFGGIITALYDAGIRA